LIFDDALKAGFWEGYNWDKYCELDMVFLVVGERFCGRDMVEDLDLGFDRIMGELVFNFGREVEYNAEELPDRKICDIDKGLKELRSEFWNVLNGFEFEDGVLEEISSSFTGLVRLLSEFLSNL
jgi:hypothetical protein